MRTVGNLNVRVYKIGNTIIPEPKAFSGVRDAKEVDNFFFFDMEMYFNATKCDSNEDRLKIAPICLFHDAKL